MSIARKPKAAAQDEATAMKLIGRGGSTAARADEGNEPPLAAVLLRIPVDMLARIDASVKRRRPVRISRLAWIIETLQERLERES